MPKLLWGGGVVWCLLCLAWLPSNQARAYTTAMAEPCNTTQPKSKAGILDRVGARTARHPDENETRCSEELWGDGPVQMGPAPRASVSNGFYDQFWDTSSRGGALENSMRNSPITHTALDINRECGMIGLDGSCPLTRNFESDNVQLDFIDETLVEFRF